MSVKPIMAKGGHEKNIMDMRIVYEINHQEQTWPPDDQLCLLWTIQTGDVDKGFELQSEDLNLTRLCNEELRAVQFFYGW